MFPSKAAADYRINPADIPNSYDSNQHMKIDGAIGRMESTRVRPIQGNDMELRAEIDLLVARSACLDLPLGGKPVDVINYEY